MNDYRKSYPSMILDGILNESATDKKKDKYQALKKYPDTMYESIEHKDKLIYLMKCLECMSPLNSLLEQSVMESLPEKIPYHEDNEWKVPSITPIIPYNAHRNQNDTPFTYIYREDTKKYFTELRDLLLEFDQNSDPETAKKIISMGWFATSDARIDGARIKLARDVQKAYMEQFNFHEILLDEFSTDIQTEETVGPSMKTIFFLTTHDENGLINRMGICLDHHFATIYHVSDQTSNISPIEIESLNDFKSHGTTMSVRCFFLEEFLHRTIAFDMKWLSEHPDVLATDYMNLFRFTKSNMNNVDLDNRLIIAQLIYLCIKILNIDFINKIDRNMYKMDNPSLYKAYDGLSSDFNPVAVSNMINTVRETLFSDYHKQMVTESEVVDKIFSYKIENLFIRTNNKKMNAILEEVMDMLTPTSGIVQDRINSGYLAVPEDIKKEVDDSYELLSSYDQSNIQGMKQELARLFYLNSILEIKIKSTSKKDTPEYKAMIDLGIRILTIFHTYAKIVKSAEPEFNFMNYILHSDYKDKVVTINKRDFKYDGKNIRKYIELMKVKE